MRGRIGILLAAASGLIGCAHVDFSSKPDMSAPAHLEIYTRSIPYVLVAKGKDGVTATVFYLRDPESAMWVQQHQGIGTSNLTFTLTNGVLTTYGLSQDSKVPETITATSGLLSSAATFGTASGLLKAQSVADFNEQGKALNTAVTKFNTSISGLILTDDAQNSVASLITSLGKAATHFIDPAGFSPTKPDGIADLAALKGAPNVLKKLSGKSAIDPAKVSAAELPLKIKAFDDAKSALVDDLKPIEKAIFNDSSSSPDFQLFEIKQPADGVVGEPQFIQIYPK